MTTSTINSLQRSRIQLILDEDLPSEYNTAIAANVWTQWSTRFGVTFLIYDDERISVQKVNGDEVSNGELNKALTEITESLARSKSSVHRVKSSDKIKSVTTTVGEPNPASLEKYIKQLDVRVPLATLKSIYNQASQEIETELKDKSPEEQLAHIHYLRFRADRAQEIYSAHFAQHERKTRITIDKIRKDSKTKRTKPAPSLSKPEKKFQERNLSPIQIMMKSSGLDYLNEEAIKTYTARYKAMMGDDDPSDQYVIETTSSTTKKYGKEK